MDGDRTRRALPASPSGLVRSLFLDPWRAIDEAAARERAERDARGAGYDTAPLVAFCAGAVLLTLMEAWGGHDGFLWLVRFAHAHGVGDGVPVPGREGPFWELSVHAWWAIWRFAGFFVAPALLLKLRGERLRDHGLAGGRLREHAGIYVFSYVFVLALVFVVSQDGEFTRYYPFYKKSHRSWLDFATWELLYVAQFFGLEFFFRGYWLAACRRAMGSHAIFAMVVPYVMIHFGKPLPETLAATFAGVWLGTLAMRTGSIWGGFLVHVAVAVSMDVAALLQTHGLPRVLAPTL